MIRRPKNHILELFVHMQERCSFDDYPRLKSANFEGLFVSLYSYFLSHTVFSGVVAISGITYSVFLTHGFNGSEGFALQSLHPLIYFHIIQN